MTEARIHDRGYMAYDGPRHGPGRAMANLSYHTVQRVLGLKRPIGRRSFLPSPC